MVSEVFNNEEVDIRTNVPRIRAMDLLRSRDDK